jgi:Mg/Co/Ni transporter MgtE
MSPRAACRLETLGFREVYDYTAGKADWLGHGLPREGEHADRPRAGDLAREDVVTCQLEERVDVLRGRIDASPYGFALVVSDGRVLLGRVRKSALGDDAQATAEDVMEPGPSTVRPDSDLRSLIERLRKRDLKTAVMTTPDGKLVGVLRRADAEGALSR